MNHYKWVITVKTEVWVFNYYRGLYCYFIPNTTFLYFWIFPIVHWLWMIQPTILFVRWLIKSVFFRGKPETRLNNTLKNDNTTLYSKLILDQRLHFHAVKKLETSSNCRFTKLQIFASCHLGKASSSHTAVQTNQISTPLLLVHVWVSFVLLKVRSSLPHLPDSITVRTAQPLPSPCKLKSHLFKKYLTSSAPTRITPFFATSSCKYAPV